MRYPYIKRKTYLHLLKEIKNTAKLLNVELRIYHRPIKYNRNNEGKPNYGEMYGSYSQSRKKIICTFFGKIGYGKKLNLLLHELRHAIHDNEGLFKDYYNPLWEKDIKIIKSSRKKPCIKTAFLAEVDCNKFAYYWLRKKRNLYSKRFLI